MYGDGSGVEGQYEGSITTQEIQHERELKEKEKKTTRGYVERE